MLREANLGRSLANVLVWLKLRLTRALAGRRIAAALHDPMGTQRALLADILARNKNTTFGRQHGFAEIEDYAGYAARVPVSDFERLRPYVEAEIARGEAALTTESPVCYARTSGTTGKPKDLPLTATHLDLLRRTHETAVAFQHRAFPEAFAGSILAIVSPAREGVLGNGKPFGSASGLVARNTPPLVASKFILPPEVLSIEDSQLKYLAILRLVLARRDLTYVGVANASTLLMLARLFLAHRQEFVEDLRNGTFFLDARLAPEVRAAMQPGLAAAPERATEVQALPEDGGESAIAALWPHLRLIVCWTCASAGVAVDSLRRELLPSTRVLELGYVSSEFRGTITLGRRAGSGLPTLDCHFFEFVERERWDAGEPVFLTLDQLRRGGIYYVLVTTPSGLYRYFINDLVRVEGMLHKTPLLRFLQKGKGVTNITGEKLYESQVLTAVRGALDALDLLPRFVMMLADDVDRVYRLYVETDSGPRPAAARLAEMVDARLASLNIEYQAKRESQRLAPVEAYWLQAGLADAYKNHFVRQGQREGQFKTVALAYRKDSSFDFTPYIDRS